MIQTAHVVDETDHDMRKFKASNENIDGSRAFRAVEQNGGTLLVAVRPLREKRHGRVPIPMMENDILEFSQPLPRDPLVRMIAQFDRMNLRIRQIFRQHVSRLPARPAALDDHANAARLTGVNDESHFGMQDAARLVGLRGDGSESGFVPCVTS